MPALGVALQLDAEGGIARNLPGKRRENPFPIIRECFGIRGKDRFARAIKNADAQAFGRQVQPEGVVVRVLRIALQHLAQILVKAAQHC